MWSLPAKISITFWTPCICTSVCCKIKWASNAWKRLESCNVWANVDLLHMLPEKLIIISTDTNTNCNEFVVWDAATSMSICVSAANIYFYCSLPCFGKKSSNRISAIEINELPPSSPPPQTRCLLFELRTNAGWYPAQSLACCSHHMRWGWWRSKCGLKPFCNRTPYKMLSKQCTHEKTTKTNIGITWGSIYSIRICSVSASCVHIRWIPIKIPITKRGICGLNSHKSTNTNSPSQPTWWQTEIATHRSWASVERFWFSVALLV